MAINIDLSESYFKKHNNKFEGINCSSSDRVEYDNCGNQIVISNRYVFYTIDREEIYIEEKLLRLSDLVKANTELFCQLEYKTRGICPTHVRDYDLKLIVQNLIYCGSKQYKHTPDKSYDIVFNEETPLAVLGYVAQAALRTGVIVIKSCPQTAAVCHLFGKLCQEAVFNNVFLDLKPKGSLVVREGMFSAGVVSGKADVEAAVDVLLDTPKQRPWKIKRILVQDKVMEQFKKTMETKQRDESNIRNGLKEKCAAVYCCGGKVFLFEFAGDEKYVLNEIIVEAYRTVKELLTLVNELKPLAVSLWSESIAESNEIAHNINSNIVWINGCGNFDGPPKISQSFYSVMDFDSTMRYENNYDVVSEPDHSWIDLSIIERVKRINRALKSEMGSEKFDLPFAIELDSFLSVSETSVCTGKDFLAESFLFISDCYYIGATLNKIRYYEDLLTFVARGGLVAVAPETLSGELILTIKALRSAGAPLMILKERENDGPKLQFQNDIMYKTKVVWTSIAR